MKTLVLFSLLCHFSSPVKHSLKYIFTSSYGVGSIPEFVVVGEVDDVLCGQCDSNRLKTQVKTDWMERFFKDNNERLIWHNANCHGNHKTFKASLGSLMQHLNQSGGVHIFQRMNGCEWDDETGEVKGFLQYGYDGEDLLSFDPSTSTWITPRPQSVITKHELDRDSFGNTFWKSALHHECVDFLKQYLAYGRNSLQRRVLPSVSLLQKTSSSPVTCHATGFYPDRASLFWRKDGEEHHEDVDHGEILPNHDGTFQMSADLKSVKAEDWRRYDCVFQLSGVKEDIVTKLEEAAIRTNEEKPADPTSTITAAAVVVVFLVVVAAAGFMVYKRKKAKVPPSTDSRSEVCQSLTADT